MLLSQAASAEHSVRKVCYPWLLGACGRNVVFGQNVVLRHPHKIRIGDNVVIDDHCLLDAKGESNGGITMRVASSSVATRFSRAERRHQIGGANLGFNCGVLGQPGDD